ncbi:MAG: AAA family ATPase [Desulfomonilia bacterium]
MGKSITISRDYGCGAIELAKALAKDLGYEYLDKGIVVDLAKKMKTSEGDLKALEDGKSFGLFKFIEKFMTKATVKTVLSSDLGYVNDEGYRTGLRALMSDLADRGNVIILGRGGQCVLQDRPDVVHVRFIAPMEFKRRFLSEKAGIPLEEAETLIRKKDQERAQYHEKMFSKYSNDPTLYHITINLAVVDRTTAMDMVKLLL